MKTKLWMLGAAVAALTSCTQSEVVEIPESRVIGFDSFVGKNSRAAYLIQQKGPETDAKDNLYQFWVYGYEAGTDIFGGTNVYWDATNSGFTYDNHKIWNLGQSYNFAAYSDGNNSLPATTGTINTSASVAYSKITNGSQLVFTNYTAGENDLLAAIVSPITINSDGSNIESVPLIFEHMLSCVKISLRNSSQSLYLHFDNITFNGVIADNCTYKIENAAKSCIWANTTSTTSTAAEGTYTLTTPTGYLAPGGTLNLFCFVIPQNNDISFSIKATTYEKDTNSDVYSSTNITTYNTSLKITDTDNAAPNHATWQPGYLYNYSADIAAQVHYIHFDVHVEDWTSHNSTLPGTTTSTTTEP